MRVPKVWLVGMQGVGKSTLARLLKENVFTLEVEEAQESALSKGERAKSERPENGDWVVEIVSVDRFERGADRLVRR